MLSAMRLNCVLLFLLITFAFASDETISVHPAQLTRLKELIKSDDEAGERFRELKHTAMKALDDKPNPIKKIQTEGKLNTDPVKIRTKESLADMKKLHALGWAYAVTGEEKFGEKAREFLLAWARENSPTGDPIDETTLQHAFVAFDLTRELFNAEQKKEVKAWMKRIAEDEMKTGKKNSGTSRNNWQSHRIKIVGLIGYALGTKEYIEYAEDGYKKQLEINLKPDGSSIDFHDRDALHYHCYDLEPLLELAIAAKLNGTNLYDKKAADGASLSKSVNFLVPYCTGAKTHAEFVNSKVAFDKKRAESGDKHYEAGHMFEPRTGAQTMELASFFDESFTPVYFQATGKKASKYPSWQFVLNAVRR